MYISIRQSEGPFKKEKLDASGLPFWNVTTANCVKSHFLQVGTRSLGLDDVGKADDS